MVQAKPNYQCCGPKRAIYYLYTKQSGCGGENLIKYQIDCA